LIVGTLYELFKYYDTDADMVGANQYNIVFILMAAALTTSKSVTAISIVEKHNKEVKHLFFLIFSEGSFLLVKINLISSCKRNH
jgi:hypothetical protein